MIKSIEYLNNKIKAVVAVDDAFVTVELSGEEIEEFKQLIIGKATEKLKKGDGHYSANKATGNLDFK